MVSKTTKHEALMATVMGVPKPEITIDTQPCHRAG